MRLFIAIWSLVPPWSESAQSPSSSLCFWNVHHSSVGPISHLNACSSCLRRFLCSPSQPVFISSSLTNIISKLKTIPLPRLFMKMLSCVVPRTLLMDTAQQISFHHMKWMIYTWLYFLSFNPICAHAVFSPLQLLNLPLVKGLVQRLSELLTGCSDSPVPFHPLVKPFRVLWWICKTRFCKTRVPGTKAVLTRPWHVTAVWALAPNYIWK